MSDQQPPVNSLIGSLEKLVVQDPENPIDYSHDEESGLGFSPRSDIPDEQTSDSNGVSFVSVPVQPVTLIATKGNENKSSSETAVTETGTQPTPLRGETPGDTRINFLKLKCSSCSEMIDGNLSTLYVHKQTMHGLKPYACLQRGCNSRFDERGQMSGHCRINHKDQIFRCKICSSEYSDYGGLYQHNKNIHLEGLFECNVDNCGLTTKTLGELEKHIKNHPKKYICFNCKEGFITKEKLKSHGLIHEFINQS